MAHMIETMAYAGTVPWHGLGVPVAPHLTPEEILIEAGLNWTVEKRPLLADIGGGYTAKVDDKFALVRNTDNKVLDVVGTRYKPTQNADAFDFFKKFVDAGRMTMETAGALDGGKRVWALARMKDADFALANDDKIEGFLLLCQPHVLGLPLQVLFTPTRVVCHNTLTYALNNADNEGMFKMSHVREFNQDVKTQAELALGLSAEQMKTYRETAEFLSSKRATDEMVIEYFARIYQPKLAEEGEFNRTMNRMIDVHQNQPGREMSEGTWWTAFNAVTYFQDHITGRNANNRMKANWFGPGAPLKARAMNMAVDYAKAA